MILFGQTIRPEQQALLRRPRASLYLSPGNKALLIRLGTRKQSDAQLQQVFKPLGNEGSLTELQLSKASVKDRTFKDPKLRIYTVRVGENTYVVTGGAIKLTNRMGERDHTQAQWERVQRARDWLKSESIVYPKDLKELL